MTAKPTYSKKVIEIANYMFAYPEQNREAVLAYYGAKWRKGRRTIERYYQQAKEYNISRIQRQEKSKDELLVAEAKEAVKKDIATRDEALTAVTRIMRGVARKVGDEIIVPSDNDIIKAATWFADINGWKAPAKSDINITRPILKIEVTDNDTVNTLENIKTKLQ